jgi:hypothetical protein
MRLFCRDPFQRQACWVRKAVLPLSCWWWCPSLGPPECLDTWKCVDPSFGFAGLIFCIWCTGPPPHSSHLLHQVAFSCFSFGALCHLLPFSQMGQMGSALQPCARMLPRRFSATLRTALKRNPWGITKKGRLPVVGVAVGCID